MEINPQNVCEVLRAIRIVPEGHQGCLGYGLFQHLLLKVAHHIEEHNKLPSLKQIRRWQSAALKINE